MIRRSTQDSGRDHQSSASTSQQWFSDQHVAAHSLAKLLIRTLEHCSHLSSRKQDAQGSQGDQTQAQGKNL